MFLYSPYALKDGSSHNYIRYCNRLQLVGYRHLNVCENPKMTSLKDKDSNSGNNEAEKQRKYFYWPKIHMLKLLCAFSWCPVFLDVWYHAHDLLEKYFKNLFRQKFFVDFLVIQEVNQHTFDLWLAHFFLVFEEANEFHFIVSTLPTSNEMFQKIGMLWHLYRFLKLKAAQFILYGFHVTHNIMTLAISILYRGRGGVCYIIKPFETQSS